MSTGIAPQVPQAAPAAPDASPEVDKAMDQVLAAMGKLRKAAYAQSPDSPFVEALHQVEMAMLEIGSQMGTTPDGAAPPDEGMGPDAGPPMPEDLGAEPALAAAQDDGGQAESMDDAARQTRDMMLQAAAARKPQRGLN